MSIRNIGNAVEQAAGPPALQTADVGQTQKARPPADAKQVSMPAPATSEQVRSVVEEIQRTVQKAARNLEFSVDDETGKTVVSIIDKDTGDLVRQIPSEELMEIAKSVGRMQGLLVNSKA